jgi:hypothetical protein
MLVTASNSNMSANSTLKDVIHVCVGAAGKLVYVPVFFLLSRWLSLKMNWCFKLTSLKMCLKLVTSKKEWS